MAAKTQNNEVFAELVKQVQQIPVENVIGKATELIPKGKYLMGLCPFPDHLDQSIGSFVVTPAKGIWHCFACENSKTHKQGRGGNGISFVMEYCELGFKDAVYKMALDFGVITEQEYSVCVRKKIDTDFVKKLQRQVNDQEKVVHKKADSDVIACVYSSMAQVCDLNKSHERHLKKERMLSSEEMKDYFSFPNRRTNLANLIYKDIAEKTCRQTYNCCLQDIKEDSEKVKKLNQRLERVKEQFPYVPGFYWNSKKETVDFYSYRGIGFLCRDDKGKPVGIQIRKDMDVDPLTQRLLECCDHGDAIFEVRQKNKEKAEALSRFLGKKKIAYIVRNAGKTFYVREADLDLLRSSKAAGDIEEVGLLDEIGRAELPKYVVKGSRYVWFSSASADMDPSFTGGSSPGSPGGVVYPKERPGKSLCITEGRFKANAIAKKDNTAVYVSGVSNWRVVMPYISRISKKEGYQSINIMFDADLMGNTAVHGQLVQLATALKKENLLPNVIIWPIKAGKGIDDLIIGTGETYYKYMKKMDFFKFEKIYQKALRDTLNVFSAHDTSEIQKKDVTAFVLQMQNTVEEYAGLN